MIRLSIAALMCVGLVYGCSNTSSPNGPGDSPSVVVSRVDVRPDSASNWLYYSIVSDSIIAPAEASMGQWDVRLAYLKGGGATRTIDILFNHGVAGGPSVQGYVATSRFENISSVEASAPFKQEDTTVANRIVPNCVTCPNAVFVYDPLNHVILPAADKTVVVRLRDGSVWAFQVTSIYQGGLATPTLFSPIGFYHWRAKKLTVN